MEDGAFESERYPLTAHAFLPCAKGSEVLCGLWDDIVVQLKLDATNLFIVARRNEFFVSKQLSNNGDRVQRTGFPPMVMSKKTLGLGVTVAMLYVCTYRIRKVKQVRTSEGLIKCSLCVSGTMDLEDCALDPFVRNGSPRDF